MQTDGIAMSSIEGQLMAQAMAGLKADVGEVKAALGGMQKAVEALVRMDEQQINQRQGLSRAFDEIKLERERRENDLRDERQKREEIEKRLHLLEVDAPSYKELRRWVIGGVLTGVAALLAAMFAIVFKIIISDPVETHFKPRPAQVQQQGQQ